VDTLHVHGYMSAEEGHVLRKMIWTTLGQGGEVPEGLGGIGRRARSEPLAITQLLLLHHLLDLAA
jgi:phosphoribulokinase